MTTQAKQRPATRLESLVFALCNTPEDRRSQGGPTVRLYFKPDGPGEARSEVLIGHLDIEEMKRLHQQTQEAMSQLHRATQQFRSRSQRLRGQGYSFDSTAPIRVLHRGQAFGQADNLEDALNLAEQHRLQRSPAPIERPAVESIEDDQ